VSAPFRLALAQYPIEEIETFAAYEAKITRWIEGMAQIGCDVLVFPEYGAMELARLAGREIARDLARSIAAMQSVLPQAEALHATLAQKHGMYILGASAPVRQDDGRYCNTARFYAPSGASHIQHKIMMTRFETERWGISAGTRQRVFDTVHGKIGVAICFDVEFPLVVRALVEAGAELIVSPSCTDHAKGHWRVHRGAQARALENQCFVATAPTVGTADWSEAVDVNVGFAALYGPPDHGVPDDGVIVQGPMNAPLCVRAEIDLSLVQAVRNDGKVFTHGSWPKQPGASLLPKSDLIVLR
jgi:predicted amidohydrolase